MTATQRFANVAEPRRRVALLGLTRNTDNYGVRVLLTSAVEALSRREPDADITLLDYGRSAERWAERVTTGSRTIDLLNLRFSWKPQLPNNIVWLLILAALWRALPGHGSKAWLRRRFTWLDRVLRIDAHYAIGGGDSFSDIYGLERFLYVVLPQVLVLLLGKPLILLPQTYGPFAGRFCRAVARQIVCRAQCIYSRDDAGVETVRRLTGDADLPVTSVPDLGFGMTAAPLPPAVVAELEQLRARGLVVGINVSRLLYVGGYTGDNMFGLREPFTELIDHVLDHLTRVLAVQVLLVPHVCGGPASQEDETRLCAKLEAAWRTRAPARVHHLDFRLDHQQMKSLIGMCSAFVGARMHACIGAVSQGVPTVCLAYSAKFAGVMRPLGAGVRVADLRTHTKAEVATMVSQVVQDHDHLRTRLLAAIPPVCDNARHLTGCGAPTTGQPGGRSMLVR